MEIKKTTLYMWGTLLLLVFGGYLMMAGSGDNVTGNVVAGAGSGEVQEVVIGMKNYNYYPESIKVKAGQPVKISLDSSATGCFRDFTIRDLGVRKYLQTPSDFVEFTPTKKGTYIFACSMGMGYGKLIVK